MKEYLDAGQDVAMLNLGDVSVYATFGYLQEILEAEGYKTVMLPRRDELLRRCGPAGPVPDGRHGAAADHAPGRCAAEVLAAPGAKVLMNRAVSCPRRWPRWPTPASEPERDGL